MKYLLTFAILLSGATMLGQEPSVKYKPTELQSLRLKVSQQQAQIAQKDLFIAQQNFQASLAALNSAADKVKQENSWDAGVIFNPETLAFIDAPKAISAVPQENAK